ncbi:MAG: hypothetical protein KDE48_02755 [Anaerolineales bacterium]|nr:hypothetical protein [Anaerolineales bacterium]
MRPFELLLILTTIPFLIWGLTTKPRPRWLNWLPIVAFSFTILHLVTEGYRWQMLPAYLLVLISLVLAVHGLRHPEAPTRRGLAFVAALFGLLCAAVALFLPIAIPVAKLPPMTGPHPVGTTSLYLVDENRPEIYTADPDDKRELMAQFWYPTTADAKGEDALYLDSLNVAGPVLAERFNLPSFLFDHINLTDLDMIQNAPVLDESLPVIIFSHGLTGIRMQNTTAARELASHGFLVAALDHTYGNALTVFPDGRVILYDEKRVFNGNDANPADGNQLVNVWADDIAFLLAEMANFNAEDGGWLNGRVDLSKVGVFGHSTGGGTTVQFCMQDERCQAGIGLDSWVLPVDDSVLTNGPTQPFMFINTPVWLGPENAALGENIFDNLPQDGYLLALAGSEHYDFSDLALFSPFTPQLGLSGSINSHDSLKIQNAYIVAFFDQYLRENASALLDAASPYSEVTIEKK